DRIWVNGTDMLPIRSEPVPSHWDHSTGQRIGPVALDNCFAGWDGEVRINWSSHAVTMTADPIFRHLVVYTPPDEDFFCVEPVSHMNDAISWMTRIPDHGLHVLAPGETVQGEVTFRIATAG